MKQQNGLPAEPDTEVVRSMRLAPITRNAIVELGVATLLPVGLLLLTIMPLEELLDKLVGILV